MRDGAWKGSRSWPHARSALGKYGCADDEHIDYVPLQYGKPAMSRHPHDDGVWLASATALDELPEDVHAVVSLCLTGTKQMPAHVEYVNFRLMDKYRTQQRTRTSTSSSSTPPGRSPPTARRARACSSCVASHSRTPAVGVAYSMLRGVPLDRALAEVCDVLPMANPNRGFQAALKRLAEGGSLA